MSGWRLEDIPWHEFDAARVDRRMVPAIKAAALVEFNAGDYRTYLHSVFRDDARFLRAVEGWAEEEIQHGRALGRWAELADPGFNFEAAFRRFRANYQLPLDARESVRGSLAGELIARSIVEIGTTSYYTVLADAAEEPVLKAICRRIAEDEYAHYCLFQRHLARHVSAGKLSFARRLAVVAGRIGELRDDELARAYHAANGGGETYHRRHIGRAYALRAILNLRRDHVERAAALLFAALGVTPGPRLLRVAVALAWGWLVVRRWYLRRLSPLPAR